ncbi:hypothetical protein GCM10009742_32970 [Kribbella karoonensis]|uniref:Prepilin-type processing-associated H-X9-DG protein n=1 Tax=Kribbella karoonensis TaxID=324851 RepID=A0ABP4PLE0_9ACTN
MLLVVIVAMLLCVTSQQVVAQRLRVRQQAIPLVAQVHGYGVWHPLAVRTDGSGIPESVRGQRVIGLSPDPQELRYRSHSAVNDPGVDTS